MAKTIISNRQVSGIVDVSNYNEDEYKWKIKIALLKGRIFPGMSYVLSSRQLDNDSMDRVREFVKLLVMKDKLKQLIY